MDDELLAAERALQAAMRARDGADVSGRMRYTRTWAREGGRWRVLAAHLAPAARA